MKTGIETKQLLNGDDWKVSGWMRHQWHFQKLMETDSFSLPGVLSVPATVPGAVQADLLRAGIIEDWNYGENFLHMEWVEHREWVYEKHFSCEKKDADRYELRFEGLDYNGFVFLNGKELLSFSGMHVPYIVNATEALKEGDNLLRVVFTQVPEVDGQVGYTSKETTLKSRYNYGWDWMPRMVNIGIFGSVELAAIYGYTFRDVYPKAIITADGNGQLQIRAQVESYGCANVSDARIHCVFSDENGECIMEEYANVSESGCADLVMDIDNPQKWFPNGFGKQPLYKLIIELLNRSKNITDTKTFTIGFRSLSYTRPHGASPDALPYTPVVNGVKIPLRGLDWVPLSPFYGTVTEEQYKEALEKVQSMHINLLRVWGGALLESEVFYRLCDEMGILVWQEFPQSSSGIDNSVCEETDFIQALSRVAESFILRRRSHVSLTFWCGGNELYTPSYVPQGTETKNLAALAQVVKENDPDRLFLPASPSGPSAGYNPSFVGTGKLHDTHGPWNWGGVRGHYEHFNHDDSLLHSEVGAPAASRLEILQKYADGKELWPPRKENRFWLTRGAWWLHYDALSAWFGDFETKERGSDIQKYVKAFRYTQMEALRYAATSVRACKDAKAGIIIWMGNEPFPNAANTSVLEFDLCPKPSYYALRDAFAPEMVGLRYDGIEADENGFVTIFPYYSSDNSTDDRKLQLTVYSLAGKRLQTYENVCEAPIKLAVGQEPKMVEVATTDRSLVNRYVFVPKAEHPLAVLLDAPRTTFAFQWESGKLWIENTGKTIALYPDLVAFASDGHPLITDKTPLSLLPGERICLGLPECTRAQIMALNSDTVNL